MTFDGPSLNGATLTFNGTSPLAVTPGEGISYSFNVPELPAGTYAVVATTIGSVFSIGTLTVLPNPVFVDWSVNPALPGETVLLRGSALDFQASGLSFEVFADGPEFPVVNTTSTSIAIQLPASLEAAEDAGAVALVQQAAFTLPPLSIVVPSNVSSTSADPPYAGEIFFLFGSGWSTTSRVTFDGVDLPQFQHSDDEISFTVPFGARLGVPVDVVIYPRSGSTSITFSVVSILARIGVSPPVSYFGSKVYLATTTALAPDQLFPPIPDNIGCLGVSYERAPGTGLHTVSAFSIATGLVHTRCSISGAPFGSAFEHRLVAPPKTANSKLFISERSIISYPLVCASCP